MKHRRPIIDGVRVSTAERIVLGGAGAYVLVALAPAWYRPLPASAAGASGHLSGLRGFTLLGWALAILAVGEILTRLVGFGPWARSARVAHPVAGLIGLLSTLLGLWITPEGYGRGWGIWVGLVLAIVWIYGGYMLRVQPDEPAPATRPVRPGASA